MHRGFLPRAAIDPMLVRPVKIAPMTQFVSLDDAKTRLSALVDQVAAGEEIVISKNGVPHAKLVPVRDRGVPRKPANAMGITFIAPDFDEIACSSLRPGGHPWRW